MSQQVLELYQETVSQAADMANALNSLLGDLNVVMPCHLVKHFAASKAQALAALRRWEGEEHEQPTETQP